MDPDYTKSTQHLTYGAHSMEGEHHPNEDRYKVKSNLFQDSTGNGVFYAGLFDGHGGALCAEYCKRNMHRNIIRELKKVGDLTEGNLRDEMIVASLLNAFSKTEDDFLRLSVDLKEFSGACANVLLIYRDTIYVANLGDCRAVLGRTKGRSIGLSRDHKATVEKSRIRKVGGFVKNGRVNGVLAISRTIGDREFKDPVTMNHGHGSSSPLSSSSSDIGGSRSRSPSSSRNKTGQSPKSPGGAFIPPPVTRRVSSPNTILLKNVRETVDSPARTRVRQNPANGGTLSRSSSAVEDTPHSNSREPSPLPFSVAQASSTHSGHSANNTTASPNSSSSSATSSPKSENGSSKRGTAKSKRNSADRNKDKSPSREGKSSSIKISSSAGAIPSSPLSVGTSNNTATAATASDSDSASVSGSPATASTMTQSQSQSQQHSRNKSGESDSNITASNSSSTPIAVASKSKKEKESASDLSESPEAPSTSMSHSDSEEGESSEFVEGMFDVIECYDAESKQKKFGFKKRRPPKDPKYETATIVSAIPEITIMRRSVDDDWLFLASDGFYDLFTSKQAGLTVNKHLQRNARDRLSETSKALCSEAALLGSEDDITGILILLGQPKASTPAPASAPANPIVSESPETEEE